MILYVNEIEITEKIINLTFKSVFRKCLINTPLITLAIPGHPQKGAGRENILVICMSENYLRGNYMTAEKNKGSDFHLTH